MNLEKLTSEEPLIAEQAILSFHSRNKARDEAYDGTVVAVTERIVRIQGRKLIQPIDVAGTAGPRDQVKNSVEPIPMEEQIPITEGNCGM